ncbi:cation diffusion facilitator family transporter [Ornithinimicrobium humiphilum]|uniref:Cation diffusion facilitator family transporter n=1 Tax=Ornithinimicrobium humiphilum TaxID=125288 RepID=A0A543KQR6_9MICO|nr:cation diffusion facilitator family transporter [Ornithinimicrobium humiphilum]TQM97421.1 cation diffusion facilitator family transporter [Ornithinimicrobium humiphilum]
MFASSAGGPPPSSTASTRHPQPEDLTRFAWLSIAAALVTIGLKSSAWLMTGSVGLLSDAAESLVNLVAAVVALVALRVALRPPDANHHFGHSKAEYFSAAVEGLMIFIAAALILMTSVQRFLDPQPLENLGIGLAVSVLASVVNGTVAWILIRAGRKHRSIVLTADGRHLLTDVWTSVGVVAGVGLVWLTGWDRLDPIVAFAVGLNILVTGWNLIRSSTAGLMDVSLPKEDNDRIREILEGWTSEEVQFHAVRTRESGHRRFMEMHLLVPGEWTVKRGHDLSEDIIESLMEAYPDLRVSCHLEPIEDPRSYEDMGV